MENYYAAVLLLCDGCASNIWAEGTISELRED